MEKLNYSALKRKINLLIEDFYLIHQYEESNEQYPIISEEEYYDYLGEKINFSSWTQSNQKSAFIYKVIFKNVYYKKEGVRLNVTDVDIQEIFKKFTCTLKVFEDLNEHKDEYRKYLYQRALEVIKMEEQELEVYEKKSLLRKIIDTDSLLSLQLEEIKNTTKILMRIDYKFKGILRNWKEKKISGPEMDEMRIPLDDAREYFMEKRGYFMEKYKRTSESRKYRRRKFLKDSFTYKELYGRDNQTQVPTELNYKNLTTVQFILEEYCKWYNTTFAVEISEYKEKTKQNMKAITSRQMEYNARVEKLLPYINSSLSLSKIAIETNISSSAVQRILSHLRK